MPSALKLVLIGCLVFYWVFCAVDGAVVEETNENDMCPEYSSYYCACSKYEVPELTSVKMCLFPKSQDFACIPCPSFLQDRINCSKCPKKKCPICSLKFVTDSSKKNNSGVSSAEGIIEMRNSETSQAGDIGVVDNSGNFTAEDSFSESNSRNSSLEEKGNNENTEKFQQDADLKFVTDSSDQSNSKNSSEDDVIEMRNSRTFQAAIGVAGNSENSRVEDSFASSNSENPSLKERDENTVTQEVPKVPKAGDSETSTVEVLVSSTTGNSKTWGKDGNTNENSESSTKNFASSDNDPRKFSGIFRSSDKSKTIAADKNVSKTILGRFVEEGLRLHTDISEAVVKIPLLRRLFQFDKTKKDKRVIHLSINDTDFKSRSKRSLPQNDWCPIPEIYHGRMYCTIGINKKECSVYCHNGYTYDGKESVVFKCSSKEKTWSPRISSCQGSPQNVPQPGEAVPTSAARRCSTSKLAEPSRNRKSGGRKLRNGTPRRLCLGRRNYRRLRRVTRILRRRLETTLESET